MNQNNIKKTFHHSSSLHYDTQVPVNVKDEVSEGQNINKIAVKLEKGTTDRISNTNLVSRKHAKKKKLKKKLYQPIGPLTYTQTLIEQTKLDNVDLNNNIDVGISKTSNVKKEITDNQNTDGRNFKTELEDIKDENSNVVTDSKRRLGKRKSEDNSSNTGKVFKTEERHGDEELAPDVKPVVSDEYIRQEGESTFYCTICDRHIARTMLSFHINGWIHKFQKKDRMKKNITGTAESFNSLDNSVKGEIKMETKPSITSVDEKDAIREHNTNKINRKYSRESLLKMKDEPVSKCIPTKLDKEFFVDGVWSASEYRNRTSSNITQTNANFPAKANQKDVVSSTNINQISKDNERKRPAETCTDSFEWETLQWKRRKYEEDKTTESKTGDTGRKENENRPIKSHFTTRRYPSTRHYQTNRYSQYKRNTPYNRHQSSSLYQSNRHYNLHRTSYSNKPYPFHNYVPYNQFQSNWRSRTDSLSYYNLRDASKSKDFSSRSDESSRNIITGSRENANNLEPSYSKRLKGIYEQGKRSATVNLKDGEKTIPTNTFSTTKSNDFKDFRTEFPEDELDKKAKDVNKREAKKYVKELFNVFDVSVDCETAGKESVCETTIVNFKTAEESKAAYAKMLSSNIHQQTSTNLLVAPRADNEIIVIESDKEDDENPEVKKGIGTSKAKKNILDDSGLQQKEESKKQVTAEVETGDDALTDKSQSVVDHVTKLESNADNDNTADVILFEDCQGVEKNLEDETESDGVESINKTECQNYVPGDRNGPAEMSEEEIFAEGQSTHNFEKGNEAEDTEAGQSTAETVEEVESTNNTNEVQSTNNKNEGQHAYGKGKGESTNNTNEGHSAYNTDKECELSNNTKEGQMTDNIVEGNNSTNGQMTANILNQNNSTIEVNDGQMIKESVEEGFSENDDGKERIGDKIVENGQTIDNTEERQFMNNVEDDGRATNDTETEDISSRNMEEEQTKESNVDEGHIAATTGEKENSTNNTNEGLTDKSTSEDPQTIEIETTYIDLEVSEASNISVPVENPHKKGKADVVVIDLDNNTDVVIIEPDNEDEEVGNVRQGNNSHSKGKGRKGSSCSLRKGVDKDAIVVDTDNDDDDGDDVEIKNLEKDVETLYCTICKIRVDSDLWTGHMRGKRHRKNKKRRLESKHCKNLYKICIEQLRKQINRKKREQREKQKRKSSACKDCRKNKNEDFIPVVQDGSFRRDSDNKISSQENVNCNSCSKQGSRMKQNSNDRLGKRTVESTARQNNSVILIESENEGETQTTQNVQDTISAVPRSNEDCTGLSNKNNKKGSCNETRDRNVPSSTPYDSRQANVNGQEISEHTCQECNLSKGFDGYIEGVKVIHSKPCALAVSIRIPEHKNNLINYSEKLVKPDCYNLKQIQWESGCYITLINEKQVGNEQTGRVYILVKSYQNTEQAFMCLSSAVMKIKRLMNTIKQKSHHHAYYYGYKNNTSGVSYRSHKY